LKEAKTPKDLLAERIKAQPDPIQLHSRKTEKQEIRGQEVEARPNGGIQKKKANCFSEKATGTL
jgi:hypothetical protein